MEIIPFTSIGVLSFGDNRKKARDKLASSFSTFVKSSGSNPTDSFDDIGLHLYYDDDGGLEYVEAFPPADVTFRGISFLGRKLASVKADLEALGYHPKKSDVGVDFRDAGITITAESKKVEGVGAHRKGYFDELDELEDDDD